MSVNYTMDLKCDVINKYQSGIGSRLGDPLTMVSTSSTATVTLVKNEVGFIKAESCDERSPSHENTYLELDVEPAASCSKSNDRDARNKAEKLRRNKLNSYINELSTIIPTVVESSRKVDKTSILRLAANDLRKDHVFGKSLKHCHMDLKPDLANTLIDILGGFIITVTCKGVITVISPNVQNYLGHCQIDLLGQNLYAIIHTEDREILEQHIYPMQLRTDGSVPDEVFNVRSQFTVRMVRAGPRSEPAQFESCCFDGHLRRADKAPPSGCIRNDQVIKRQRVRRDRTISSSGNDVVFVGMVRVLPRVNRMREPFRFSYQQEYWTRHLADGRIVQCDQRISIISGYMSDEITGVSGFTFMHREDVRWVVIALRQMYDFNKPFGESCYRLLSRTGQFLYLRTRGFLEIDKNTKVVQSFVCVNSLVPKDEGEKMIEEMKKKYSAMVDFNEQIQNPECEQESIEDPDELEQVIMHLVTSVQQPEQNITILSPKPTEIKLAIEKSVNVINKSMSVGGVKRSSGSDSECDTKRPNKQECP